MKALNVAKLIHILTYLASITIALSGASLVFGVIKYGVLFSIVFLGELVLICGFVILVTSILYYAILTIFSGEKLKDIINYFQIVLTIVMMLMYQLIGRLFNFTDLNVSMNPHWWNIFLPSTWFAAPFSIIIDGDFNAYYVLLSAIGGHYPNYNHVLIYKGCGTAL